MYSSSKIIKTESHIKPKFLTPLKNNKHNMVPSFRTPRENEIEKEYSFLKKTRNTGVAPRQIDNQNLEILGDEKKLDESLEKILNDYEPISPSFDIQKLKNLSNNKLIAYENCFYYGQTLDEMRHGLGNFFYIVIMNKI